MIEILNNSPVDETKLFINEFVGADTKLLASIYSTLSNKKNMTQQQLADLVFVSNRTIISLEKE